MKTLLLHIITNHLTFIVVTLAFVTWLAPTFVCNITATSITLVIGFFLQRTRVKDTSKKRLLRRIHNASITSWEPR